MRLQNNSIRKYVQALLSQLNDFEIQYIRTDGSISNKKIPIVYGTREKSQILDFVDAEFYEKGNYNILPRQYLRLVQMQKNIERVTNKLNKMNVQKKGDYQEFVFSPIPYEFTFELVFHSRGMNEAQQIIEDLQTRFKPTLEIDIWDQQNLTCPTRIPVKLLDIGLEDEGYSEGSTNLITVTASLSMVGNLYQPNKVDLLEDCNGGVSLNPQKTMPLIKQVGYSIRQGDLDNYEIIHIDMFDVDENGKIVKNNDEFQFQYVLKELKKEVNSAYEEIRKAKESNANLELQDDTLVTYYINEIKKHAFDLISNVEKDTEDKDLYKKINKIIWSYDQNITKIENLKEILGS